MNRPLITHVTRRPHDEPPIRDDDGASGVAMCWALVAVCGVLWWWL